MNFSLARYSMPLATCRHMSMRRFLMNLTCIHDIIHNTVENIIAVVIVMISLDCIISPVVALHH